MGQMNVFLYVLIVLLILPFSVEAIGLAGDKLGTVVFEPGKEISNKYTITNTDKNTILTISGELDNYAVVNPVSKTEYYLVIKFPDNPPVAPGTYPMMITASELADDSVQGINALVSVSKMFHIAVYSFEKEIEASFTAPHVNENKPVPFRIDVQSRTYSNINSVTGEIIIFDDQMTPLGKITTETKPLKSLASETLTAFFDTRGLPPAEYFAKAVVNFDGQQKELNSTFKIGNMDLLIKNYTTEATQGFGKFFIDVENNWGNELRNVYAKLLIDDKELLHTPSINLAPWGSGRLEGIVNFELEPGRYTGKARLFFESEEKELPITITILEKTSPELLEAESTKSKMTMIITSLAGTIIILIVLFIFILLKKPRASKRDL